VPSDHGFVPSTEEDVLRRRVKAELRKRMRGLRRALPERACAEKSRRIVQNLACLEPIAGATKVALFWPIEQRHEVDLRPLHALLQDRGVRVAFPAIEAEGAGSMTFRFVADLQAMLEPVPGLREPSPQEPVAYPGELDAIVVPALAIDPRGHRIGYGGGYYDRALPQFAPRAATVGVAFDFQLVLEVPDTPTDIAVGWIVTEARVLTAVR
jgi:5-formyltetrahydrofolate cyclo-ligase